MADFEEVLGDEFEDKVTIELWVADNHTLLGTSVIFGGIEGTVADPRVQVLVQANQDIGGGVSMSIRAGGFELTPDTPKDVATLLRETADILTNDDYTETWRTELEERHEPEEE